MTAAPVTPVTSVPDTDIPVWHAGLCVGHPDLDAQHISLFELGRSLLLVLQAHPESDDAALAYLLDIEQLATAHCQREEAVLAEHGCPGLDAHRLEHEVSLRRLRSVLPLPGQRLDRPFATREVRDWMIRHVEHVDMAHRQYMGSLPGVGIAV